jgi:hypothetical protein
MLALSEPSRFLPSGLPSHAEPTHRPRRSPDDRCRIQKTPGPDHPITLEPSSSHVVVRSGSVVIAETEPSPRVARGRLPAGALHPARGRRPAARCGPMSCTPGAPTRERRPTTTSSTTRRRSTPISTASVWYYPDPFPAVAEHPGPRGLLRRPGRHHHLLGESDRTIDRPV